MAQISARMHRARLSAAPRRQTFSEDSVLGRNVCSTSRRSTNRAFPACPGIDGAKIEPIPREYFAHASHTNRPGMFLANCARRRTLDPLLWPHLGVQRTTVFDSR